MNELFDATKEGITENTLRKTVILEALKMAGKEVRDIFIEAKKRETIVQGRSR